MKRPSPYTELILRMQAIKMQGTWLQHIIERLHGARKHHPWHPYRYRFAPASPEGLKELEKLGLPGSIVDFYRFYEPQDLEGPVRVCSIQTIVEENSNYIPGSQVSSLGYIVFATTYCGDAICFDLNSGGTEPRIVHISHEEDYSGKTPQQVLELNEVLCNSMMEFWECFATDDPECRLDPDARSCRE